MCRIAYIEGNQEHSPENATPGMDGSGVFDPAAFFSPPHSDGEWDFNWCDVGWLRENFDHTYMEEHVRVNHFRNHYEVSYHQPVVSYNC